MVLLLLSFVQGVELEPVVAGQGNGEPAHIGGGTVGSCVDGSS
ncbi:hypothetical protein I546_7219 [Mycobacterium kansasii 732]|nr:hypothetical protein I546_7219 [Mycobacterium kansasii 732]